MRYLVVVDMQKDFVDGALGTAEARAIVPAVVARIRAAARAGERVFVTMDTHGQDYMASQEGHNLPVPHCLRGTPGWQLDAAVAAALEEVPAAFRQVLEKPTFGSIRLPQAVQDAIETDGAPEEVELIGLCTGICVISNALLLKAHFPEVPITVDAACCACVSPASHQTALDAMRLCQIGIKNTD